MTSSTLLKQVLQSINPQVPQQTTKELSHTFSKKSSCRGAPLLQQGEHWEHVMLIETGLIRLHFLHADGREFNKSFFAEGSLLCPLTPAMLSHPSLFAITCVEPTLFWSCPIKTFMTILGPTQWPLIQTELLMRLLDGKLQREHDLLALNGQQRYKKFCTNHPQLAERIPLVHQASFLGLTDVTLSRLRRKLKNK
jgi:CRP-like cAMP-binding protein